MSKSLLLVCYEQAVAALTKVDQVTTQYRQARELFQGLSQQTPEMCEAVTNGAIYLQPTNGDPIQLPVPPLGVVQDLLAAASEPFNRALREAWRQVAEEAAKAITQLDTVMPQEAETPASPPQATAAAS